MVYIIIIHYQVSSVDSNYLCSKIQMAKNCHSHNTRRAAGNHLQIPSSNAKFGMRAFAYRASKLWNDLPNELLDIKSLLKFKTSVKGFFGWSCAKSGHSVFIIYSISLSSRTGFLFCVCFMLTVAPGGNNLAPMCYKDFLGLATVDMCCCYYYY